MSKCKITCPNCENRLEGTKDLIGAKVTCPICQEPFWVKKSLVVVPENYFMSFLGGVLLGPIGVVLEVIHRKRAGIAWSILGWLIGWLIIVPLFLHR